MLLLPALGLVGYVHPRYMHPDRPTDLSKAKAAHEQTPALPVLQPAASTTETTHTVTDVMHDVIHDVMHDVLNSTASLRQALCPDGCEAVSGSGAVPTRAVVLPVVQTKGQIKPFWLPEGNLTQLIKWKSMKAGWFEGEHYKWSMVRLMGKTVSHPTSGNQWFDQLVVSVNGEPALDVARVDGSTQIKVGGREVPGNQWSVNGVEIMVVEPETESKRKQRDRSRKNRADADGSHTVGKSLVVKAAGVEMRIFASAAPEHMEGAERAKYTHLNVVFEGGLPEKGFGLFAELAGTQRMSNSTLALLKDPRDVSDAGVNDAVVSEAGSAEAEAASAVDANARAASLPSSVALNSTLVPTPATARLYAKAMDLIHNSKAYRKHRRRRANAGVRGVTLVQHDALADKVTCVCPKEARENADRQAAAAEAAAEKAHQAEQEAAEKMSNAMASADVEGLEKAMASAESAAAASAEADKDAVAKQDAAMQLSGMQRDDMLTPAAKAAVAKAEAEQHAPPKGATEAARSVFSTKAIDHGDHGVSDQPVSDKLTLVAVSAMMAM